MRYDVIVIGAGSAGAEIILSGGAIASPQLLLLAGVGPADHLHATTQHHSSGTCKMGPATDPMAVVDQHSRVHGLEGIRVVDAAVMPDVVRANTNATTIMIAERMADVIRQGL